MRVYLFAPNSAQAQDFYVSKIQLEEGVSASPYEKTTYKNQQLVRLVNRLKRINQNLLPLNLGWCFIRTP